MAENGHGSTQCKGTKDRRLILWCIPRTGSTALAKCLSFLDEDTEVWFEPFNLCRMVSIGTKKQSGHQLPKQYTGNEMMFNMVVEGFKQTLKLGNDVSADPLLFAYGGVKKSLEDSERRTVVVKEMAVASYESYDYIPEGFRHILFIRDPARVIPSFRKMIIGRMAPEFADADLEKVHQTYPTHHWYGEMHALWTHLKTNVDANPLIIDTEDFLANPAAYLKKICETIGVEYRDALLKWEASTDALKKWKNGCIDYYTLDDLAQSQIFKRAYESSEFVPTSPKPLAENLTPDCVRIIGKCVDIYNEMYPHRFIPEQS